MDAVNTLTITIAPDDWAVMQADLEDIYAPQLNDSPGNPRRRPRSDERRTGQAAAGTLCRSGLPNAPAAAPPVAATDTDDGNRFCATPAPKEQMVFSPLAHVGAGDDQLSRGRSGRMSACATRVQRR
jgi:hypothetical protein